MRYYILLLLALLLWTGCQNRTTPKTQNNLPQDTIRTDTVPPEPEIIIASKIKLEKKLRYDQHTLEDRYPYQDTVREFQWEKIRDRIALLENLQEKPATWAILQNYKNWNGEAPLVKEWVRNDYKRVSDIFDVERYQSVPLYDVNDSITPVRYGRDGSPVRFLEDGVNFVRIETVNFDGEWLVPKRYVKIIGDTVRFRKAVFIDRVNQNITTLEQQAPQQWDILSMNPATTGIHQPPYAHETPLGFFLIQEKKPKMIYLKDGSSETGGFAPWASRFNNGGYIHGVPTVAPGTSIIEYSNSLGTIPRSHMCVRTPSSHAKFIYDWQDFLQTMVFVLD